MRALAAKSSPVHVEAEAEVVEPPPNEGGKWKWKMKTWLWLIVGMLCGASLSSMALEKRGRQPAKLELTVPAVSAEDAEDKARELFREGQFNAKSFGKKQVVAVGLPTCRVKSGPTELFICQAPVTLAE